MENIEFKNGEIISYQELIELLPDLDENTRLALDPEIQSFEIRTIVIPEDFPICSPEHEYDLHEANSSNYIANLQVTKYMSVPGGAVICFYKKIREDDPAYILIYNYEENEALLMQWK